MVEALPDNSLRWQLPAAADSYLQKLSVPKAAMTRLGVTANTDCTVRVPSGEAFESRLVFHAKSEGGQIQRLWSDIREKLQPVGGGGGTISLRCEYGAEGQLVLHLAVLSHAHSQVLRPPQYVLNKIAPCFEHKLAHHLCLPTITRCLHLLRVDCSSTPPAESG